MPPAEGLLDVSHVYTTGAHDGVPALAQPGARCAVRANRSDSSGTPRWRRGPRCPLLDSGGVFHGIAASSCSSNVCAHAVLQQHRTMVAPASSASGACCEWLRGLPPTHLGHRRRGASPRRVQQALHCSKHLHHATSSLLILELRRRLERTGVGNAGAEECSVAWHTPPVRWL